MAKTIKIDWRQVPARCFSREDGHADSPHEFRFGGESYYCIYCLLAIDEVEADFYSLAVNPVQAEFPTT